MHFSMQESDLDTVVGESEINVILHGTVDRTQQNDYSNMYFLTDVNITYKDNEYSAKGVVAYIIEDDQTVSQGDQIEVTGKLSKFSKAMNEGGFDLRMYYKTLNIDYGIKADKVKILKKSHNVIYRAASWVRNNMLESYKSISDPDDYGIYSAMIMGDKTTLNDNIYDLYQASGISHILSISGLHISIIGMCLYKLLRRLGCVFLPAAVLAGGTILFYGEITGNGISTNRAIIMFIVFLIADVIGRTYDVLSGMSMAALIMLIQTPILIYNTGFLLSYGAIVGIITMGKALRNIYSGPKIALVDSFIISFGVQLVTFPILLFSFYEFPLYAVILNIIVVPLMDIVMILGIIGGIAGCFSCSAGTFIMGLPHYILELCEWSCDYSLSLPYSVITLGRPSAARIVIYYVLLAVIVYISSKKIRTIYKYIGFPLLYLVMAFRYHNYLQIDILYVGQGDGIFIETPEGLVITIDGGSADEKSLYDYTLEPFMKSQGIRHIDYAIVTHCDSDHISGLIACLQSKGGIAIECLIMPEIASTDDSYNELVELALSKDVTIQYISKGDMIGTGTVKLTCLHPTEKYIYNDRNASSTVILLEYRDFSMLLTGDISRNEELTIINEYDISQIDVLKAAHHGSSTASCMEFLHETAPEYTVISAGIDNSYGHPDLDTLERIRSIQSEILVTSDYGMVEVICDKSDNWKIMKWK